MQSQQIEEILIVKNAHENYGISTEDINQIARVPALMPLPLRPAGVRGLCSVSGGVVSLVDMNLLLDMPEVDIKADASRLLSLNAEYATNALLVSAVYNTVVIKQKDIEYIDRKNDPVVAIYKYEDLLVQIVSLEELFNIINRVEIEPREIKNGTVKYEVEKEENSSRFLVFSMSSEKYALEIDYLQEIILPECEFTNIVGTSKEVLGLITLREELLLVIDLRIYYGFEAKKTDDNRILIVSFNGKKVGLYIDSIIDIKNVLLKDIERMSDNFESTKIAGVIHDEKSLISFFDEDLLNVIFKENETYIDSSNETAEILTDNESVMEVIVFKLSSKEYAFEVDNVDEIIDMVDSTALAFTEDSVDGIINIRGQVVTIVSLFEKLNIQRVVNEDSKIIICNINEIRLGFIVDSVSDILEIKEEEIRENSDELFDSVLHLDNGKRLVLTMDVDKLIKHGE